MAATKQKAKSETTRDALCSAVVHCLVTDGYHGITTTNIAKQAKVSRGAMQHHFPSKMASIVHAAEFIMQELLVRIVKFPARPAPADGDPLEFYLLLAWSQIFISKEYLALVELRSACRTDRILAKHVRPLLLSWDEGMYDYVHQRLKPHITLDKEESQFFVEAARVFMRGMIVKATPGMPEKSESDARDAQVHRFIRFLVAGVRNGVLSEHVR